MNVYFIDPIYVKSEGWKPLLTYLRVKVAYSFISKSELPTSLLSIIEPYLVASYTDNTDKEVFANNCVYWLREHFEKNIRLITEDYDDVEDCTGENRKKYSSRNAFNNIRNLDEKNCLILLPLFSRFTETGEILEPKSIDNINRRDYPTHIASYCLNILHKKRNDYIYHFQSAFLMFDRYFSKAYLFDPKYLDWSTYKIKLKNGEKLGFMAFINGGIRKLSPEEFPIIDNNGINYYTMLRTPKGDSEYKELIEKSKEAEEKYNERLNDLDY